MAIATFEKVSGKLVKVLLSLNFDHGRSQYFFGGGTLFQKIVKNFSKNMQQNFLKI